MEYEKELWEEEWDKYQYEENMKRMYKTSKSYRDPRKEALIDGRKRRGAKHNWSYHENTKLRVLLNRSFRHKLKQHLFDEIYYRVRCRDWKTYGCMTW